MARRGHGRFHIRDTASYGECCGRCFLVRDCQPVGEFGIVLCYVCARLAGLAPTPTKPPVRLDLEPDWVLNP